MFNKKIFTLLAFLFIFLNFAPFTTYAYVPKEAGPVTDPPPPNVPLDSIFFNESIRYTNKCNAEKFGVGVQDKINKFKEDEASIPEVHLVNLVQIATNIGDVNSISTLIYGNPYCLWAGPTFLEKITGNGGNVTLIYGIFTEEEYTKIIKPGFAVFAGAYGGLLTVSIMMACIKLSMNLNNGRRGAEFAEDVQNWFVSIIFLSFLWMFINLVFYFNNAIIDTLFQLMKDNGINTNNFTVMTDLQYKTLTDFIIYIAEWALTVILNFIYMGRKTVLLILLIIAPLSALALLFSSSRKYFSIWIKTFVSIVFINVIHGLVFYLIVMLDQVIPVKDESYIFKLVLLIMYIPLTGMAVSWIGMTDSSSVGESVGKTGANAIQQMGSLAKDKLKG